AVAGASLGIALDEAVIEKSVKAVVAALRVKAQQVIAQQRQFFPLAQGTHVAKPRPRAETISVLHVNAPLRSPRGGVTSLERDIVRLDETFKNKNSSSRPIG